MEVFSSAIEYGDISVSTASESAKWLLVGVESSSVIVERASSCTEVLLHVEQVDSYNFSDHPDNAIYTYALRSVGT